MIKERTLKYLFPEDEDSPSQAYVSIEEMVANPVQILAYDFFRFLR